VSPSVTEVLGWRPDALVGRPGTFLVADEDVDRLRAQYQQATASIIRVRAEGGNLLPVSLRVTVLTAADGRTTGAVIGMTDVAELVRARDEARDALAAEARTRLSMDEAAIGLVIASIDGTITYANPAMHRVLQAADGSLVGVSVERGSSPMDRDSARRAVGRIIDGRAASEHLRRRLVDFAGGHVWVDAYLSPIRDSDGAVDALLIQVVDVTIEVANRDSLARSTEHFRLLAENATDVVYETDVHGMIVWVSPSVGEALGWQPDALLGTRAIDLVHPDDLPLVEHERAEVYEGGVKESIPVRFRTLGGAVRTMSVSARPIRGQDGVVTGAVVGLRDVTAEVEAVQALERSERLFRAAMEEAPTGMALADPADVLVEVNPVLARMLGCPPEDMAGRRLRDFLKHGAEADPTCAEVLAATGETRIENHEHEVLDPAGGTSWIAHSVSVVRDRVGAPLFFVHQVADITATKQREEDLGFRASHDLLTGLLNREGLLSRLAEWLPGDESVPRLAVLYCDVDRLKQVNDTHGHAAGDAVLTAVAHRMRTAVRHGDIVARISGDEFVIVLDRIQDVFDALAVAEKVRVEAHGPVPVSDGEVLATLSVGAALAAPGDRPEDLLARADAALYRAKVAGRDRIAT
jgi:diguanylate cyclase (GGDEF)-like protein/PAS domain S-box-containing protein